MSVKALKRWATAWTILTLIAVLFGYLEAAILAAIFSAEYAIIAEIKSKGAVE